MSPAALTAALALITSHAPAHLAAGASLGSIQIPKIGVSMPVDQGDMTLYTEPWPETLNPGPAHYPGTALPWQQGITAFAGHRVTHTHPFLHLDRLRRGDKITLRTPWGRLVYIVTAYAVVSPSNLSVLGFKSAHGHWYGAQHHGHRLVLTACHPPGSATERYVVFAKLTGAAR